MNTPKSPGWLVPQRNERLFYFPPGFWKRQLATKYLEIAGKGDIEALQQLIDRYPEFLNKRGPHNRTLLWEAARRGKLPAVQWLVGHGAELDATGAYNHESFVQLTPYCAAIFYHQTQVADYLRAQGTRSDIFRAAFLGDLKKVAQDLAAKPGLLHAEDPYDLIFYVPLLAFAVVGGQAEMVDFLLQRGVEVAPYSAQLLLLAARPARRDIIDLLVAHGAELRAVGADLFVATNDLGIIEYLLQHGTSATRSLANGFSPIIYLARADKGEHPEKIQMLLEYGAEVNAVGPKGRTALHYAAAAGFLRVIKLLLDHGADFTLKDDAGETALGLAQSKGKTAAVRLLIHQGAAGS